MKNKEKAVKNLDMSLNSEFDFLMTDFFESVSDECQPVVLSNKNPLFTLFDYDSNGNLIERSFYASAIMV